MKLILALEGDLRLGSPNLADRAPVSHPAGSILLPTRDLLVCHRGLAPASVLGAPVTSVPVPVVTVLAPAMLRVETFRPWGVVMWSLYLPQEDLSVGAWCRVFTLRMPAGAPRIQQPARAARRAWGETVVIVPQAKETILALISPTVRPYYRAGKSHFERVVPCSLSRIRTNHPGRRAARVYVTRRLACGPAFEDVS